jgi:hypothetical protein
MKGTKLFRSLIKCKVCGCSYIHIKENRKSKYICNKYKKGNGCSRRVVVEEEIAYIVKQYCNINKIDYIPDNDFLKGIIKVIYIDDNGFVEIIYKDNNRSIWTDTTLQF